MPRTSQVSRLLAEFVVIVLLAETLTMFAVPYVLPKVGVLARALLDAMLLVLVAAPVFLWRVRRLLNRPGSVELGAAHGRRGLLLATGATLVLGCGVTCIAVQAANEREQLEARAQFDRLADRLAIETERRINLPVYGLKGARGVYAASKSVERKEFRAYVASRDLPREFPGSLGFGFIERVARRDLARFVERERADDAPDFDVRTSGSESDLYVVKFVDPIERNRAAWGYDIGSEPVRRAAIERAVRSGEPTLTPRIRLVQDTQDRAGFLFFVPVYRNGSQPNSPAEREASLVGVLYAPIVLEDVLAGATEAVEGRLDVEIFDGLRLETDDLLYDWDGRLKGKAGAQTEVDYGACMFHDVRPVRVGGRSWSLAISTSPSFEDSITGDTPALVGLAGLLLSMLLASVIWSLGSARARSVELAREMTSDLAAAKLAAENALRDFEALRSTLDEHSIVSVADARGRMIDVNKAFCRISGYTREELIGQDHRIINSGHHPRSFWMEAWRTISAGHAWRSEVCNRSKSGALYWVDSVIAPFVGADGRVERYFSIRTDITARKQAEAEQAAALALATALARSNDARQAARAVNDALGETTGLSRTAVLLYDESGVCRFVGWRGLSAEYRHAVEGHCPWKQGEPDAVPIVVNDVGSDPSLAQYADLFRKEGIAALVFVPILTEKGVIGKLMIYGSKTGTITPARVQAARSAAASLGSAVARLRMAEALSTNERRFRSLVEGADVIVWEFDAVRDVFTYVSPQAARLGYPLEAWLERGFWAAHLHPDDRGEAVEYCANEVSALRNHRFQYRMLAADGRVVWLDDFVSIEKVAGGQVLLRGVLVDITESKLVAEQLMDARTKAEAATRAKSEFLANMSHEIRTPLTAILGYTELLREDGELADSAERRLQAVDTICSAGQYLLTVINDVLDLSKIEAGKMSVEHVETPLPRLVQEVADLVRPRASEKGVELRVRLATPVHELVLCDPTRLRQILMNLAGNAAKFTEQGSVTLVLGEESGAAGPRFRIDVEDTGPGLSPEAASRLFVAFSQADASVTRKHGGTGLGLTICRRLAELLGGTVALVRSAPGAGAVFRVELPLVPVAGARRIESLESAPPASAPRPALPSAKLAGRILLVEDGRDNQRLISLHLRRAGAEVEIAENGLVALARIEAEQRAGRSFDLLLSDMQMPEMDGYTLARTLRERGSAIAIVALTAHAMAEDRQTCLEAGCDDYTTKPIDRNALLECCARWIGKPGGRRGAARPA